MESVSIKALVNNTASTETKVRPKDKQNSDKSFSKVINNNLSRKEDKTAEAKTSDINTEPCTKKLDNEDLEKDIGSDKPTDGGKTSEQLMELLQMLTNSGASLSGKDISKLKHMISELLQKGMTEENSDINQIASTVGLNAVDIKNINLNKSKDVNELAAKIVDKVVSDTDFRAQLLSKLNEIPELMPASDSAALKKAIVRKLNDVVNYESKHQNTNSLEAESFDNLISYKPAEEANSEASITSNEENSKEFQLNSKPVSKEDKLLRDLLSESDSKGKSTKENITDKITNVLTRFDAIRTDKPAAIEAAPIINKNSFDLDFIKTVKFMDVNNLKELSVKILPKELGEIVIRLSMDNGVMKANITAANKETYNILNSQLPAISNQLADQNMNIQSFNLSLYNGDNFLFNGDGSGQGERKQQGRRGSQVAGIDGEESTAQNNSSDDSNINALA